MTNKKLQEKKSRERATALVKDAAVEGVSSAVPGLGAIGKWVYKTVQDRREQRIEGFFRQLL